MQLATRRWVARLVRIGLVLFAVVFVGLWIANRVPRPRGVHVVRETPAVGVLPAGDLRIYSVDSTVDVVLAGDRIMSGLSPKTVESIRVKMQDEATRDSTGLGAMIASQVKQAVAQNIGIHVMYPLSEVEDVRYEDGELIIARTHGGDTHLFGKTTVRRGSHREGPRFAREDAERFIAAVHTRKAELHLP
jgi:hypothetical protein